MMNKLDVILRCKDYSNDVKERFENNLSQLPIATNNIIIETSFPLGLATMRAINKVETEFFITFDDDIEIPSDWFSKISHFMYSKVGAIDGYLLVKGMDGFDEKLNELRIKEPKLLKKGQRSFGLWNTLCRTSVFKDWEPSIPLLTSWEDYELGNHCIQKGFQWITVPIDNGYHYWSWDKVEEAALWSAEGFKQTHSKIQVLRELINNYRFISKIPKDHPLQDYLIYQTLKFIDGLKSRSKLEKPHNVQGSKMIFGEKFSYVIRGIKESGFYEMKRSQLQKYVNKNSVCVDVGANIGYWTLLLAKLGKKVYSFEPDPYNLSLLDLNCRLNNYDNVVIHRFAVGDQMQTVNLYHSDQCTGMHRIYQSKWCTNESIPVDMIALDDMLTEKIDFLKIDVEGSELGVLKGATRILEDKPTIFMEFDLDSINEYGSKPNQIMEYLKDYDIKQISNNFLCIPKKHTKLKVQELKVT